MQPHPVSTIQDPTFNQVANRVIDTKRGVVVETIAKEKVVIVPLDDYEALERQRHEAGERLSVMMDKLRADTAHLSPEEQQRLADEIDDAILAERGKERQQRKTAA